MRFTSFVIRLVYSHVLFFIFFPYCAVLWYVGGEVLDCEDLTGVAVLRGAGRYGAPVLVPVLVSRRVLKDGLRLLGDRCLRKLVLEQNFIG